MELHRCSAAPTHGQQPGEGNGSPMTAQSQSQQQRETPRGCWGAIFPPHCWVIQEGSCFIEEMHKNSSLKAFLESILQDTGLKLAFLGHVQQWKGHHQKPLVETGVEGSYIPQAFCPMLCLLLSRLCLWALCFLSLSLGFLPLK